MSLAQGQLVETESGHQLVLQSGEGTQVLPLPGPPTLPGASAAGEGGGVTSGASNNDVDVQKRVAEVPGTVLRPASALALPTRLLALCISFYAALTRRIPALLSAGTGGFAPGSDAGGRAAAQWRRGAVPRDARCIALTWKGRGWSCGRGRRN